MRLLARVERPIANAQVAGAAGFAIDRHERRHIGRRRQFFAHHRPKYRMLHEGAGAIPCEEILRSQVVCRQVVADATNNGVAMCALGEQWQVLTNLQAGNVGFDRTELAAILGWSIRLHIKGI